MKKFFLSGIVVASVIVGLAASNNNGDKPARVKSSSVCRTALSKDTIPPRDTGRKPGRDTLPGRDTPPRINF